MSDYTKTNAGDALIGECDVCGEVSGVERRYEIRKGDQRGHIELCPAHAKRILPGADAG